MDASIISIIYAMEHHIDINTPTKEMSDIINQSLKYQYFTKKDLDFANFGKSKQVNDFVKEDFEILIKNKQLLLLMV